MYTSLRIAIILVSFGSVAYALYGVDFGKMLRKGHQGKAILLYLLLSMGLAHLVAQFLLSLSITF